MVSVHLRLTKELAEGVSCLEKMFGFNSAQEFIRDAIRRRIEEYEKKVLIKRLKNFQGKAKQSSPLLSREEWFKEYSKKNPSEIFREFNLKV